MAALHSPLRSAPAYAQAPQTLRIVRETLNVRPMSATCCRAPSLPRADARGGSGRSPTTRSRSPASSPTPAARPRAFPLTAIITNPAAARTAGGPGPARSRRRCAAGLAGRLARPAFDPASAGFDPSATSQLAGQAEALVDAIDFPGFVRRPDQGRLHRHREDLDPADGGLRDDGRERRQVGRPVHGGQRVERAGDGPAGQRPPRAVRGRPVRRDRVVKQRDEAAPDQMGGFLQSLGLPFDLDTSDPEVVKNEVVPAQRMTRWQWTARSCSRRWC